MIPVPFHAARLGRSDYATDAATLARRLLGQRLVRIDRSGRRVSGVIVETEAYLGVHDRASHAFGGRRTPRNRVMYARPGTAYVYFTYGMHHCFNVVCGEIDEPAAVLIRALEPAEGLATMHRRRGSTRKRPLRDRDLCSGPGKLCEALGIDLRLNGADLCEHPGMWIEPSGPVDARRVRRRPRVGVAGAGPRWARRCLRFVLADNPHVSVP
jgi:DNA-3-methyladenine glycosylase